MIKGIWWHIVVLLLAESLWMSSSLNNKHRQKRQMRNAMYLQRLRNTKYLRPIPIRFPQYYKEPSELHSRRGSSKKEAAPWIPIDGTAEAIPRKNIYVPPLGPPPIIITRKPLKTSFNVPLTKSIQVSQAKPNIQTTGYIRKNRVKTPVTETNKKSQLKIPGSMAEGTAQTLLNFTPLDNRWRPKSLTTPYPIVNPNHDLVKTIDSNVEEHFNYTGINFAQNNPTVKINSENGPPHSFVKNQINFVTKFTPGDVVKVSSEIKSEKFNPSYTDSSEIKHSTGNQNNHKILTDEFKERKKISSNLWKEGNSPYQGHKIPLKETHNINKEIINEKHPDTYTDWKTIYDSIQNTQNLRTEFSKKDTAQTQNQGSFVNDPYNAEIFNSAFRNNKILPNKNAELITKQKYNNEDVEHTQFAIPNSHEDNLSVHLEPSKTRDTSTNKHNNQIKSNFPYQGHASSAIKNSDSSPQYSPEYNIDNSYQTQKIHRPSNKPTLSSDSTKTERVNDGKFVYNNPLRTSPLHSFNDQNLNHSPVNSQDLTSSTKFMPSDANLKYNTLLNVSKNNSTLTKEKLIIAEIPISVGNQYNLSKSSNNHASSPVKDFDKTEDSMNRQKINIYPSSPKVQSYVPISNHNFSLLHKNENTKLTTDNEKPKKFTFDQSLRLKEIELKNPPEHLEFGDEEFLKPIIPIHVHRNINPHKKANSFTFSARDRSGVPNKPVPPTTKEAENKLLKTFTGTLSSKVEYAENTSDPEDRKTMTKVLDSVYFQPVFPEVSLNNHQVSSTKKFQNYNSGQSPQQISDISKGDTSRQTLGSEISEKETSKSHNTLNEKPKINNDVIISQIKDYSPKDTKKGNIQEISSDMPRIITPPPVITMKYDTKESDLMSTRDSINRTDNYVIQRKPALVPENSNRPRKPKITLSTGMLAGILIAALIFLAFLTGSMVYAFHQWKFGRKKNDRQKKQQSRSPRFPPEYLDENFAGNTYIHNNIFLPTSQNLEDRNSTDPDTSSIAGDEAFQEPTTSTARVRRLPVTRETREE